jgi:hypothetical protein
VSDVDAEQLWPWRTAAIGKKMWPFYDISLDYIKTNLLSLNLLGSNGVK